MIRNTAIAEAFVSATAKALNQANTSKAKAPWMARRVLERVQNKPDYGTVRENDINVHASFRTRQHIAKSCEVRV